MSEGKMVGVYKEAHPELEGNFYPTTPKEKTAKATKQEKHLQFLVFDRGEQEAHSTEEKKKEMAIILSTQILNNRVEEDTTNTRQSTKKWLCKEHSS